jgi:hypothetical protein
LIIRQPDDTLAQIPVWMMSEEAALYEIRATPRLPLVRLRVLRTEIDLILKSLSADSALMEVCHETKNPTQTTQSVRVRRTGTSVATRSESRAIAPDSSAAARDEDPESGRGNHS